MQQLTAIIVGAGGRGIHAYAPYALKNPDELVFVGIAEPNAKRREEFISQHPSAAANVFHSWKELEKHNQLADLAFICTQDSMHVEPAKLAIKIGYDILLEKPISPNLNDCITLSDLAKNAGVSLSIGHVLRYTDFFQTVKGLLDSGRIGKLISIQHNENVGHIHMSHSFVRGNWCKAYESSPMILAKSCHDMDILYWLTGQPCVKISSFGSLQYFNQQNAPADAPEYCVDGCIHKNTCPYYAPDIYTSGGSLWSRAIHIDHFNEEERLQFLKESPYGRCVFRTDNDVVDHQVVNMEFADGTTAAFTMCGLTRDEASRTIKIMGSKGEIHGAMGKNEIIIYTFQDSRIETIQLPQASGEHGGGDLNLVRDFLAHCRNKKDYPEQTPIGDSIMSHAMALAAEKSRETNTIQEIQISLAVKN